MSVKKYGIYLAYSPTVDLRSQGLSRYLGEFLKAAQKRNDVRFVIACPSWLSPKLLELFQELEIQSSCFDIIAPSRKPLILRFYEGIARLRTRRQKRIRFGLGQRLKQLLSKLITDLMLQLTGVRSTLQLILLLLEIVVLLPIASLVLLLFVVSKLVSKIGRLVMEWCLTLRLKRYLKKLIAFPQRLFSVTRLYELMVQTEVSLMHKLITDQKEILAWYCQTAFWSHFNRLPAPRLMAVPDVFPVHFPVGFATMFDDQLLPTLHEIENAIRGGDHFVTYSEAIKWETLVDRYQVAPEYTHVIHHGANCLDHLITVSGSSNDQAYTKSYCRDLLKGALTKSVEVGFSTAHLESQFSFLFYASQFRPHKNILSLLKSYEYLLRQRYLKHKLILTGTTKYSSEVMEFITTHNLQYDVLFLHNLSLQELAACYHLADLALNPSLSEGGCPFTFTEALSVGTPVVMARIPVTEEIITDPAIQQRMLFDPYDWKDMAERIHWALTHTDELLTEQKKIYLKLGQRTWDTVVDEHITLLDKISEPYSKTVKFIK